MAVFGLIGSGLGTVTASAEAAGGVLVPLGANFRSCDFTKLHYVSANGFGSGTSTISSDGATVSADVFLMIGIPNTAYEVRLIQGPRPGSQKCNPGDPGVASAVLNTDGNGTGTVTVRGPRQSGATNAWVFIDGPPDVGQIRGQFYTSDLLTSLA
ncbi:hypothetical protein DVS77_01585 [Mycolicibacterium moriokaense]|nr:hypothetical protein DVS77_01585 [Mycolicibacterium moriokaense]